MALVVFAIEVLLEIDDRSEDDKAVGRNNDAVLWRCHDFEIQLLTICVVLEEHGSFHHWQSARARGT